MSRFYATIDSDSRRTQATSRGHKWVQTHAAGWRGAIKTEVMKDDDGRDIFCVMLVPWKGSQGRGRVIAEGILDASLDNPIQSLEPGPLPAE